MTMDISDTTEARSDQQNADDYVAGPKVVTIDKVTKGSVDQPVEIHLVEFPGKPFKPSKTCRRVLVHAWGPDASIYAGRRMELFRDPTVKWAGEAIGGIRIAKLSHIDGSLEIALTETRGKRKKHVVEPLTDAPAFDIATCESIPTLRKQWKTADAETKALIEARVKQLEAAVLGDEPGGDAA